MKKYFVCFYILLSSSLVYSQQKDTLIQKPVFSQQDQQELNINKKMPDAIRDGFIGPMPERRRSNQYLENDISDDRTLRKLDESEQLQELADKDSILFTRISDAERRMLAALKIIHKKTTVDDTQTLANPHISVSFDDILCFLFRPDLRLKMKNKKRAKAYKTY